jgi:Family of unknown function (DUF6328)
VNLELRHRSLAPLITVTVAAMVFTILLILVRLQWPPLESVDHGAAADINRLIAGDVTLVTVVKAVTWLGSNGVLWTVSDRHEQIGDGQARGASRVWAGRWTEMEVAESPDPRQESEAQRDDRNLAELLQELRVAGLGVQVLFGFLLALPFTNRFDTLSPAQRDLYLASLVLAAVATALLLGPVAYHRLVFRRGQKESLVRAASVMAITGLAAVGLAVSAAVLLVTSYVASGSAAALITVFVAGTFGVLWFAFPLARRR